MDEEPPQIPLESQVQAWLGTFGRRFTSLRRLSGDVSPRRYCRLVLESGEPAILAVYPPEMADTYGRFLVTGALLTQVQVPVPEVLETDKAQRFMLLEDLGTRSLFELELPSWGERKPFFELAMDLAARIRELDPERIAPLNPPLDAGTLEKELEQTWRTYLHPQGMARGELGSELEGALAELCRTLAELPPEPCHRDFMARNLMPRPGELYAGNGAADPSLVVLDHQDLRLGPPTYDVASLLNDSLFPPPDLEAEFLGRSEVHEETYRRVAVQRTLKAVGTYAAFAQRGASRHLPLIPPTLRRALYHMALLPELRGLAARLQRSWGNWLSSEGTA